MTEQRPIAMSSGLPETILPEAPAGDRHELAQALARPDDERRAAIAAVVAARPRFLDAWAALGDHGRDVVERYAAYRVGYHRGLDALRANGWRGSGFVRSVHPTNQGFLRCLRGLGAMATAIGEHDEADRVTVFVQQLDP
ncbi:MAG: DUF3151 family protein [Desertimonas sp.]